MPPNFTLHLATRPGILTAALARISWEIAKAALGQLTLAESNLLIRAPITLK